MEGVFVSLIMNGPNTWVHIRQFTSEEEASNGVMLSTADFASFMFQLKAIEQSFIGARSMEMIQKDVSSQVNNAIITPIINDCTANSASPRAGTKGELYERLKNAPKKRKLTKNNAITMAFARALRHHIDGIVTSQCLGCMLNLQPEHEGHELCSNPKAYVEQYFNDAMLLLDDSQVQEIMDEQRKENPKLPACPPKTVLQADLAWCERVKKCIIDIL